MPIVEIKLFEQRLVEDTRAAELIDHVTDAFRATFGEDVARDTQVIVIGVSPRHWGIGGRPAG
jgi:phenylpyruvate tautomerase PptA (4-oxalocrotonate tautomerase family)